MDRVFDSGASATPPSPPASPSTGYATAGNPATSTPATKPGKYWYHMVTEELRKVIVDAGMTPDHTDVSQLSLAIQQLIINGGAIKTPVRAATTANIATLAGGAPNTLDGVTLVANDRVLVKDQATGSQNGLYVVSTLGTGANGTWTRAGDADGASEVVAGMLVVVQEGAAYADTVWELQTDGAITVGTTSLTFARKDSSNASVQGVFKNLQLSATGTNGSVSISCDEIVVKNGVGQAQVLQNVALTAGVGGNGVNGIDTGATVTAWYSVWVIWNGATVASLLSLSATAPTMPAGYTHKARVGWIRTDGTANKYPLSFVQHGRRAQYKVAAGSNVAALPAMASGAAGSLFTPTYVAVATANYIPSTACRIALAISTANITTIVAPNASFGAWNSGTNAPPVNSGGSASNSACLLGEFSVEGSNIYWANGGAGPLLQCFGWEDNL